MNEKKSYCHFFPPCKSVGSGKVHTDIYEESTTRSERFLNRKFVALLLGEKPDLHAVVVVRVLETAVCLYKERLEAGP